MVIKVNWCCNIIERSCLHCISSIYPARPVHQPLARWIVCWPATVYVRNERKGEGNPGRISLPRVTNCALDHAWIKGEGVHNVRDGLPVLCLRTKSDICTVHPVKAAVSPHAPLTIRQSTYLFSHLPPEQRSIPLCLIFLGRVLGHWGKNETECQFPKLLLLFLQYASLVLLLPLPALRSSHKSTLEPTTTIA